LQKERHSQSEEKNACKVKQTLKWSCGCGKTYYQQSDAERHVEETGHTMDIKGILSPKQKLTQKEKAKLKEKFEKAEKNGRNS